ncbi:DUF6247 family protein [Phytoactinopolyspora halotolerans]|uniref:Uncharacterized protein n=1 Tax=Phytoactinopolyspora halotolerans TaxID=1981512 RepID=A0A6L9SJG4_9ACTN|nr:DUF6247 family protein [Phytoactinopolyspora halotolerans]NEE04220.1 hypothetical protein [Phytoactinopolyspora halotolerans]
MTVGAEYHGQQPPPEATPRAIRAALLPEEAGDFDREFRQAMAEATETLDLTGVLALLRRWQRVAWSSQDERAHRQMLRNAEQLALGSDIATEPWDVTKARLGL